ncbi:MAG: 5-bromo-4-chloroindolyl phosphate hydrolysis family protein [Clostridia bacterium]|nr:5-bromo-4-chloroindolyl phosphate hydrolysis family protein [Clostridia bacterium]
MSKQQDSHSNIPLPIIILGYILSPPAGVVLTLLRIFTGSSQKNRTENTERVSEKANGRKTDPAPKSTRSGLCVPALVLGILTGVFLLCGVMNIADGLFNNTFQAFLQGSYIPDSVMLGILSAACFIPALICKKQHDRRNIIRSIIGKRETMQLSQMAAAADLKPKKLRKELQAMIDKGEFGEEAYIDLSSGRFMRHPDEMEEMLRQAAENPKAAEPEDVEDSVKFRSIILQIRSLNDDIKDYAVSERIYRIEEHTQNIFDYVTEHPEAMPQIRSFMNYYLPTTLKLLSSYSRIEQVGVAGENMKKSKENIERILDMLVVGFEQQVDKLFGNESMDISSEITVLEAMMKQDGLDGKSDFDLGYDPGFSDDLSGGAAAQYQPKTTE